MLIVEYLFPALKSKIPTAKKGKKINTGKLLSLLKKMVMIVSSGLLISGKTIMEIWSSGCVKMLSKKPGGKQCI